MSLPVRSYLYVGGHDEHRIAKAYAGAADAVVLDLEDAVPEDQKDRARQLVRERLAAPPAKPTWVRVNAPDSPWWDADLDAVTGIELAGLRLPKCETPREVLRAAQALDGAAPSVKIQVLIESALGLERVFDLATCTERIQTISLGEADLRADLRVNEAGLGYARARCVAAARAAGRASPVQSAFIHVSDGAGLRASSEWGRDNGFFGRSAVHPRQIEVINEVFEPDEAQIVAARRLVSEAEAHQGKPFMTSDGTFVDPAVLRSAHLVLGRRPGTSEHPERKTGTPRS